MGKAVQLSSHSTQATGELPGSRPSYFVTFSVSPTGGRSFLALDESLCDLLRVEPDELREDPNLFFDLIHCEDRGPFEEALDRCVRTLEKLSLVFMQYTRDGDLFQMRLRALPERQPDGTILLSGEQSTVSVPGGEAIQPRLRSSSSPYPRRSRLDRVDVPQTVKELDRLFEEERVYLDEDICLEELARRLRVSPHALSELLNRRLGMTYYEYVSRWRVAEACRLLCQGDPRTILQIGYDSGFRSKVAFHEAFRRFTSLSPGEYRKVRCSEAGWEARRRLLIPVAAGAGA